MEVEINNTFMEQYFQRFDVVRHKFFCNYDGEIESELQKKVRDVAYKKSGSKHWSAQSAVETYRTLEKVYDWDDEQMYKHCDLLQKITEDLLEDYVGIEGIQDLFRPSYFQFEWMMHLEYMEQQHNYSYYRDHYMHQIRNLYEMFILMDEFAMWEKCMHIYKSRNDSVARRMKDSIYAQMEQMKAGERRTLKEACDFVRNHKKCEIYGIEELCYRELFFSVSIVSALVHDVAYPLCYMKRTLGKMRHFLPLSNWFMNIENTIPRINALLKDSLLFETVGSREIENRLSQNDHGTYSAVVLLIQYYDNGLIYKLEPLKRMVIELAALVIYNHTLRYHFQEEKSIRYHNVYEENPLSFLFRFCDDIQEWDRVYFEINNQGNLFICNKCKTPMLRNMRNITTEEDGEEDSKTGRVFYTCFCNMKGINTNLFSYRKMMNVAPFKSLCIKDINNNLWHLEMKCDLGALLQMTNYNPTFAVQRIRGIGEIKDMVDRQAELPSIFVETFVSNNPFAIKTEILRRCYPLKREVADGYDGIDELLCTSLVKGDLNCDKCVDYFNMVKKQVERESLIDNILAESRTISDFDGCKMIIRESVQFYTFLVILSEKIKERRTQILTKMEEITFRALFSFFESLAGMAADEWKIYDTVSRALIADALQQMFCEVNENEFEDDKLAKLYRLHLVCRKDIVQLVKAYTKKTMYEEICKNRARKNKSEEMLFDFYSDYYFYFDMVRLSR